MEEIKNLYLVKTRGFRAYVIANSTDKAIIKFKQWLDENDYGYYWDRDFQSIELIASNSEHSPKSESGVRFDDSHQDDMLMICE